MNNTFKTSLGNLFEEFFAHYPALYRDYSDLKSVREPKNTSAFVYEACSADNFEVFLYFACRAIARIYKVDMGEQVYGENYPSDSTWYDYINSPDSQKAIEYLENEAVHSQHAYRFLFRLRDFGHYGKWKKVKINYNLSNIPCDCLALYGCQAQYLAMALLKDPVAIYSLSKLVDEKAMDKNTFCLELADKLKNEAVKLSRRLEPQGFWAVQRARWKGFEFHTSLNNLYPDYMPWLGDLKEAADLGFAPAMIEYSRIILAAANYESKNDFDLNRTTALNYTKLKEAQNLIEKCRINGYLGNHYEREAKDAKNLINHLEYRNELTDDWNHGRSKEQIEREMAEELKAYREKLENRDRMHNLFTYGGAASNEELKNLAEVSGNYSAKQYFEDKLDINRELEELKKKEIEERYK
ncbi:MAG: hypothetical protein ACI4WM_04010 [Erysipelotrichaceae bacterium]